VCLGVLLVFCIVYIVYVQTGRHTHTNIVCLSMNRE